MKAIYPLLFSAFALMNPLPIAAGNIEDAEEVNVKNSDANLVGHIVNKDTQEHLPFINVQIKGTTIGTTSDASGHYFLTNLPEGTFEVVVSGTGYKTTSFTLTFTKGKTVEHKFEIEEEIINLGVVVVSANRNETARHEAPNLVNVLSTKIFETTNSACLSQGLSYQPGVRVETKCQSCGSQQVRINGLDGPYTQILIDSRPVFSALSGVYGLEQIPANMIDRVEVIRGGGSALFGSSAIAGTINIITKEPLRNSASLSHTITGIGDFDCFENNTMMNASLVTDDRKMGMAIFGQSRTRQGYDNNGDGYTEMPELKNAVLGVRSYIRTSNYSKLSFEYHHINDKHRGGDSLKLQPHNAHIAEVAEHVINTGEVKFDYFSPNAKHRLGLYVSAQHIDRDNYNGSNMNLDAYGSTKDLTWVTGAQYNYHFDNCWFMPADLTGGIEYNQEKLEDDQPGYHRHTDETMSTASAFLQNEWKTDRWSFLIGGRLDKSNQLDHPVFSPRLNLRFNPTENINLRASYSYGFRAPQLSNADLHIEIIDGKASVIRLAENLKQENSQSISLSADMYQQWGDWQGNLMIEGFYTDISDVFTLNYVGVEGDKMVWERGNEKGARVYGATIEGKLAWRNALQFQAGFTYQQAKYKKARQWIENVNIPMEDKIFRSPDTYGYFTATYNPIRPLGISLTGTYTGKMLVAHHAGYVTENSTVETNPYLDMGFKTSYDFKIYKQTTLQLNVGIQNLFNAYQDDFDYGPNRDSGYIYGPGMPRSFYAGIKLSY